MRDTHSILVDARSLRHAVTSVVVVAATFITGRHARGDTAVSVGEGLFAFNSINASQGWRFTVDVPIQVTALGLLDAGSDGFVSSHEIAIWDEAGFMLMTTTIQAGTVHPLVNRFRYASVEEGAGDSALTPGQTYTIGYFLGAFSDDMYILHNVHAMNPLINQVGSSVFVQSNGLTMPTTSVPSQCLGPGFQFTVVPAPSAMMLMAIGTLVRSRRRRVN